MSGNDDLLPLGLINALGVAGIVVWHLQGRRRPTGRLVVQILFFTAMSAVLHGAGIAPDAAPDAAPDSATAGFAALLSKSARILWWTHLAWTIVGFLHIYVMLNRKPREAHLIQDMTIAAVYLGAALAIVGFVFGVPVGTLVATSGVVAVIFGLALQNTLGDVFSGIALTLGGAYAIGDWVQLGDGTAGRVTETNWRSTNLLTAANNIVVLPNSMLARQGLTSLSRPDETHRITLTVRFAATQRPRCVEDAMRSVLNASTRIVQDPPPAIAIMSIDAVAISVELQFRVSSLAASISARNEIIDLIHARCGAGGLALAMPAETLLCMTAGAGPAGTAPVAEARSSGPAPDPVERTLPDRRVGFPGECLAEIR
jgi:small-conductance mechanosensitive channel